MMGTCTGCGTENVEVNEQGLCANCAAATPAADTGAASTDAGTTESAAM